MKTSDLTDGPVALLAYEVRDDAMAQRQENSTLAQVNKTLTGGRQDEESIQRQLDNLTRTSFTAAYHKLSAQPGKYKGHQSPYWERVLLTALDNPLHERLRTSCDCKARYDLFVEYSENEEQMFRYLWLSDLAQLDVYITETRLQALQSFVLARRIALVGFGVLIFAFILGVIKHDTALASIMAGAGALTQFVAGVVLVLYTRSITVFNDFDERLEASRRVCISLFLTSKMDDTMKQATWRDLIRRLASASANGTGPSISDTMQPDDAPQCQPAHP
jgi:hypothetical protein